MHVSLENLAKIRRAGKSNQSGCLCNALSFFQKCDQDQSDRKEEDQRQHAVFGVVEKVCTEGNDQRAEEVRKLAEYVKEAEVFAGFVLRDDFS